MIINPDDNNHEIRNRLRVNPNMAQNYLVQAIFNHFYAEKSISGTKSCCFPVYTNRKLIPKSMGKGFLYI
ncbi:MAG TPA: hypothetical protein DEP18_08530 [Flavobacteriales bacterium]|nr:hypothetical protein [Flavobacteriales bacterium]HCA83821.1 hypothetical protein [Flavobacteriales bacterium]